MAVTTAMSATTEAARIPRRRRRRRSIPIAPLRIVIAGAMSALLGVVAGGAFDQLIWSLLVPPFVATIAWLWCWQRGWRVRLVVGLGALALSIAIAGLLAGASPAEWVTGIVTGPRRLLSTEWPSPEDPQVIVAVASLVAVVALLAVETASRRRLHATPVIVIGAGLSVMLALGAPLRPAPWVTVSMVGLAVLLLLARHGDDVATRARTVVGERSLPATLALLAAVLIGSSAAVAWSDRADPRRPEEAELTAALLDPIEQTAALRNASPAFDVFTLTDRSTLVGPSLPIRWRMSALDTYDGQRWVPSVTLRPIGERLGIPSATTPDAAPPITYDAEFLTDDVDLLPLPGQPLLIDSDGASGIRTDTDRTVVQLDQQPEPGWTVRITAEPPPPGSIPSTAVVGTRLVDDIAAGFTSTAQAIAGDGTVLEQLRRIEQEMHDEWHLDSQAPGAGQQQALIERFLTETRRGTAEQFTTGFALLARSLGVEARVAAGFVVPPAALGTQLELNSEYAATWPEVLIPGRGWLAFDPTPDDETSDVEQPPAPPAVQSPAAAQPPIAPPPERGDTDTDQTPDTSRSESRWAGLLTWVTRVGVGAAAIMVPVLLLVGVVIGVKSRRRRRRLRHADPAQRIVGAWANATDALIDAGLAIEAAWTDTTIAEHGVQLAPRAPHEIRRLAASSTAMTFGSRRVEPAQVDDAIASWRSVEHAIRAERTRWQRLRWRLSLRSLRSATRSPVAA